MSVKLTNNATSSLAVNITADATSLTIQSGDAGLFPHLLTGEWFPLTIYDAIKCEIVHVTKRTGGVFTVLRGQEGTTAHDWNVGTRADLRITRGVFEEIYQQITNNFNVLNTAIETVETKGDNSYLPKTGGTVSGDLTVNDTVHAKAGLTVDEGITADTLTANSATINTLTSPNVTTSNAVKVGTAEYKPDGNIKGAKWQAWGSEQAFEAIESHIEERAIALIEQKIDEKCVTDTRIAGYVEYRSAWSGWHWYHLPSGYFATSIWFKDWKAEAIGGRQLQVYIKNIGWRQAASW